MDTSPDDKRKPGLGFAGWLTLVVLGGLLAAAIGIAVYAWRTMGGTPMSANGWIAMILGAVFSFAVGAGLMALVFYSHRKGYDR